LMNMNSQVENFANQILKDINLKNGFNVIGHSQVIFLQFSFYLISKNIL